MDRWTAESSNYNSNDKNKAATTMAMTHTCTRDVVYQLLLVETWLQQDGVRTTFGDAIKRLTKKKLLATHSSFRASNTLPCFLVTFFFLSFLFLYNTGKIGLYMKLLGNFVGPATAIKKLAPPFSFFSCPFSSPLWQTWWQWQWFLDLQKHMIGWMNFSEFSLACLA